MSKIKIKAQKWVEVREQVLNLKPCDFLYKEQQADKVDSKEYIVALDSVLSENDIIYFAEVEFGGKLIGNGKINTSEFEIDPTSIQELEDIVESLNYSDDPLGLVVENFIEVVTYNSSTYARTTKEYPILLNRIQSGNFFGIYGTLDWLSKFNIEHIKERWDVFSGYVCFELDFPYENETDSLEIEESEPGVPTLEYRHVMKSAKLSTPEKKAKLYKAFKKNYKTSIIYFPITTIEKIIESSFLKILIRIGWQQSRITRNTLFELNSITKDLSSSIKDDYHIHSGLLHYFDKLLRNEAYILVPSTNNRLFAELRNRLLELNPDIKNNPKKAHPLFYNYELLGSNKCGILCVNSLPIRSNYSIIKYNNVIGSFFLFFNDIFGKSHNVKEEIRAIKIRAYGGPRFEDKNKKSQDIDKESEDDKPNEENQAKKKKKDVTLDIKFLRGILVEYYKSNNQNINLDKNMTNDELSKVLYLEV